jgi:branched-chain amino acid transport system substrate-binding protein
MSTGSVNRGFRSRTGSWLAAAAIAAVASLAVAACGSGSGGGSSAAAATSSKNSPFTVLAVLGVTGASANEAASELDCIHAAAAYLNAHGGIEGHQVKVVTLNDQSSPSTAVSTLLNYLSANGTPNLIWPGAEATEAVALLPVLQQHKLLSMGIVDAGLLADGAKYANQFVITPPSSIQDQAMVQYFVKQGYKSVGLFQEENAFTQSETTSLIPLLTAAGISHSLVTFPATSLNLVSEMTQMKGDHPSAMLLEAVGASAGYALTARQQVGWSVPTLGDPATASTPVASLVPAADLKGVSALFFKTSDYAPAAQRSAGLNDLLAYLTKAGEQPTASFNLGALGWDALMAVNNAAVQAKSVSEAGITSALENFTNPASDLYATFAAVKFTAGDHEDTGPVPADFPVAPEGPVVDGMVHTTG